MSLQQIRESFNPETYMCGTLTPTYFNLYRLDNTGAHLKIGYSVRDREIYLSAYYAKADGRLDRFYQDVCNTFETRMQRCRLDDNWAGVCNVLGQRDNQWQPRQNTLPGHGEFQFRFANPYADGNLSEAFLEAIRQLADIIITNFP